MRHVRICLLMLLAIGFVSACEPFRETPRPSGDGLCEGLEPHVRALVAAVLAADTPDQAVIAADRLVAAIDAGCGR